MAVINPSLLWRDVCIPKLPVIKALQYCFNSYLFCRAPCQDDTQMLQQASIGGHDVAVFASFGTAVSVDLMTMSFHAVQCSGSPAPQRALPG